MPVSRQRVCVSASRALSRSRTNGNVRLVQTANANQQSTRTLLSASSQFLLHKSNALTTQGAQRREFSQAQAPIEQFRTTDCGLHIQTDLPKNFDKILIANRGEIACRVMRTCRQLGVKTVAIYSDADKDAQHVKLADEAYRVGGNAAADSYLRGEKIVEICKQSGAQAVHPGYGFLSENVLFADMLSEAGIEFIGPPNQAMEDMGSKSASKHIMLAANVPCVPGYHGDNQDVDFLAEEAERVGFPLMIKAVLGGGGKGMRVVRNRDEFHERLEQAKGEAMSSFADDRVLMERFIASSRHVEFQVFADKLGNVVHFHERDCSVQRRNQKVLEEAPAPGMTKELRKKMGDSACAAARAVNYVGAGTVEFIVDAETDEYFFMEMNTRLQVEHCVTEMVMRRDLVQLQLHVAAGHKLPVEQSELNHVGHAIEARIYAENPDNDFLPCTGHLRHLSTPEVSENVRVETGVAEGDEITVFYDPMIAKLVVWAPDRQRALEKMEACLKQFQIIGLPTNIPFCERSVAHPEFKKGLVTTNFIADNSTDLLAPADRSVPDQTATLAVLSLLDRENQARLSQAAQTLEPNSPWSTTDQFRINSAPTRVITLLGPEQAEDSDEERAEIRCSVTSVGNNEFDIAVGNSEPVRCALRSSDQGQIQATIGAQIVQAQVRHDQVSDLSDESIFVFTEETAAPCELTLPKPAFGAAVNHGNGAIAPMPGKVVEVYVSQGDSVAAGDLLCLMEAMKMRHEIRAPHDGIVNEMLCAQDDFVDADALLVDITAAA